jgi:hypothetical protein
MNGAAILLARGFGAPPQAETLNGEAISAKVPRIRTDGAMPTI